MKKEQDKTKPPGDVPNTSKGFNDTPTAVAGKFGRQVWSEKGQPLERASPLLRSAELRKLPGEWVTEELEEDKIHELDDPHIRDTKIEDYLEEAENGPEEPEPEPPDTRWLTDEQPELTQWKVDIRRLSVMRAWAETQKDRFEHKEKMELEPIHLWFPENDHRVYEMRRGNPPPDQDRPKHLRGYQLHIDILDPQPLLQRVLTSAIARGINVDRNYWIKRQFEESVARHPNRKILEI